MLTDVQRRAFHEIGYLHLPAAVPQDDVARMRARLWRMLEHRGAREGQPSTWSPAAATKLHGIRKGDLDPHDTVLCTAVLDDLMGHGAWRTPSHWGQVLVTFPTPGPWDVPHRPWHIDHGYDVPRGEIWGMNVFLFLDDVAPRGGGTVVLRRSPLLMGAFLEGLRPALRTQKQTQAAFLASHPYLAALADPSDTADRVARFVERETDVHGVRTRVDELTGRAGDVVVCHPWLVHNIAPNTLARPRLMRASRAFSRKLRSDEG